MDTTLVLDHEYAPDRSAHVVRIPHREDDWQRCGAVWQGFVALARASDRGRVAADGSFRYVYSATAAPRQPNGCGVAEYRSSRLTFRRDGIDALQDDEGVRVVTPDGTFELTRAECLATFPRVAQSRGYREAGVYHYPSVPRVAERLRVAR